MALCSFWRRDHGKRGAELCSLESRDRMPGNASKLHQGRLQVDIWKHVFTERVVRSCSMLSGEVMDALYLPHFYCQQHALAFGQS